MNPDDDHKGRIILFVEILAVMFLLAFWATGAFAMFGRVLSIEPGIGDTINRLGTLLCGALAGDAIRRWRSVRIVKP